MEEEKQNQEYLWNDYGPEVQWYYWAVVASHSFTFYSLFNKIKIMKTLEQIKERYKSKTLDGRDLYRLMDFLPEEDLIHFGLELKDEFKGTHTAKPFTKENILEQLESDVSFGFEKALNQRGISAGMMYEVVSMWNWILEDGLEDFDEYAQYGLPLFKATAVKYNFPNPIGEKAGNEREYACEY